MESFFGYSPWDSTENYQHLIDKCSPASASVKHHQRQNLASNLFLDGLVFRYGNQVTR